MRILIADNEIVSRKEIAQMLESFGYDVTEVEDGVELLKHVGANDQESPELIVTNISMPNLDGLTASVIARTIMNVDTPIIAVTSEPLDAKLEKEKPFVAVLNKPVKKRELLKVILTLTCHNCHCCILSVDHRNHFHFDCKKCGKRYILREENGQIEIVEKIE